MLAKDTSYLESPENSAPNILKSEDRSEEILEYTRFGGSNVVPASKEHERRGTEHVNSLASPEAGVDVFAAVEPKGKRKKKKNKTKTPNSKPIIGSAKNSSNKAKLPLPDFLANSPPKAETYATVAAKAPLSIQDISADWTRVCNKGSKITKANRIQNASSYLAATRGGAFGEDDRDGNDDDHYHVQFNMRGGKYMHKRHIPKA